MILYFSPDSTYIYRTSLNFKCPNVVRPLVGGNAMLKIMMTGYGRYISTYLSEFPSWEFILLVGRLTK